MIFNEKEAGMRLLEDGRRILSEQRKRQNMSRQYNSSNIGRRRLTVRVLGVISMLACMCNLLNVEWTFQDVRVSVQRLLQMCEEDESSPYINEGEAMNLPISARIPARRKVPSHLALCGELLSRHEQVERGEEIQDRFSLQEDESVCMDWSSPHSSLMEIFASTLIGHVGAKYNMQYMHDCARTRSDIVEGNTQESGAPNVLTIQQIFPSSSLILDDETVQLNDLLQLCKGCTAQAATARSTLQLQHMTHHCILYPGSSAPLVNENKEIDSVAISEQRAKAESYPITSMMTAISDRLRMAAMEWNTVMSDDPQYLLEQNNGAIIYVDDLSATMKFELYAKHIPSSISSISILANPLCAAQPSCSKHVFGLKEFLSQAFSDQLQGGVRILEQESSSPFVASSAASYSRMILAKYLICPPGTVNCLLPALAKEDDTYAVISENQEKPNTWHWFDFVRSGDVNIQVAYVTPSANVVSNKDSAVNMNKEQRKHTSFTSTGSGLDGFGTDSKDYREGCTELRGKLGSWEQDFHYNQLLSEDTQKLRGSTLSGVTKDRYQPVSSEESGGGLQRAQDNPGWSEENAQCDLDLLNIDGLCQVMFSMKLSILQFVGDEYTEEMVLSFWKLLGLPDADTSGLQPYVAGQPIKPRKYRKTIECQKEKYEFDIAFTTNDHLVHRPVEVPRSVPKPLSGVPRTAPKPAPKPAPTPAPTLPPFNINRNSPRGSVVSGNGNGNGNGNGWGNGNGNGVNVIPNGGNGNGNGNGFNKGCGCYPFQQQYQQGQQPQQPGGTGRQFIVAGTGANAQNYDQYCNDVSQFQSGVRNYVNPNDVVMYRSAVPQFGACNCQNCPGGQRHLEEGTRHMDDEEVAKANEFLIRSVDEHRRKTKQYELSNFYQPNGPVGPKEHILDVTKLTVSHPHAIKAEGQHGRHLCAASNMRSAPQFDAWNHMLYTGMRDIANQEAYQRSIAPRMQAMNYSPYSPYAYPGAYP